MRPTKKEEKPELDQIVEEKTEAGPGPHMPAHVSHLGDTEKESPRLPLTEAVEDMEKVEDKGETIKAIVSPGYAKSGPAFCDQMEKDGLFPDTSPEPAKAPTTITVNTKFIVRPTATGISAMQATHDAMLTKLGSAVRGAFPRNVLEFRACDDAPGYVTYTLLEMLQQFGPDVALGKALPFEDEVVVVEEK